MLRSSVGLLLAFIVPLLTSGCNCCIRPGYYDPCGGMIYGPSVQRPTLFGGLFKKKHDSDNCLICQSERDGDDGDCGCGSTRRSKHRDCGCGSDKHRSKRDRNCGCAAPSDCSGHISSCGGIQYPVGVWESGPVYGESFVGYPEPYFSGSSCAGCGAPATVAGGCSGCGAPAASAGCSGCGAPSGASTPGCSGCAGGTAAYENGSHDHSNGTCAACNGNGGTTGPLFQGETVPGQVNGENGQPQPAPPAEEPASSTNGGTPPPPEENSTSINPAGGSLPADSWAPSRRALPEPRRLSSSAVMMIPTVPAQDQQNQQTHWIPSDLK